MARRAKTDPTKVLEVAESFLDSARELARSPEALMGAVQAGLDGVLEKLIRAACEEACLSPDLFSRALEEDEALGEKVHSALGTLFSGEAVHAARAQAALQEAGRHLYVLRFVLSGQEPADWVWAAMEPGEEAKLRAYRRAGGDEDPPKLAQVERALAKLEPPGEGFGRCEDCGRAIGAERFALLPYAARCTDCQLAQEGAPPPPSQRVPLWMFFEAGLRVPVEEAPR